MEEKDELDPVDEEEVLETEADAVEEEEVGEDDQADDNEVEEKEEDDGEEDDGEDDDGEEDDGEEEDGEEDDGENFLFGPLTWEFTASALLLLVIARLSSALMWFWGITTRPPWDNYGWLEEWLVAAKFYSNIPHGLLDFLIDNVGTVGLLLLLFEGYLLVTLTLGFCTRLNAGIAAAWAAVISWSISDFPYPGETNRLPADFLVPSGGWLWLLLPMVLLPLIAAVGAAGRLYGLDGKLREPWLESDNKVKVFMATWFM